MQASISCRVHNKTLKRFSVLLLLVAAGARADDKTAVELEPVIVTAQRAPELAEDVPAAVTAITRAEIGRAGVASVKDASQYAPNVNLIEFTARAISNPQVRGVGGSTTNPGVTTYIDGVPQLSADTSSRELLDVERIEFVRGAQGTLFGRNTLGGVIQVISRAPVEQRAEVQAEIGDYNQRELRGVVSGALSGSSTLGASLAAGHASRDGYSLNTVTGHRLDDRSAGFGQGQLSWVGSRGYLRLLAGLEDAHDGDFALNDLAKLRAQPHTVSHDYEGHTERLIHWQTLLAGATWGNWAVESISGHGNYRAFETTDLDLSPQPDLTRDNHRAGLQWTQELHVAAQKPFLHWLGADFSGQGGLFGFRQGNDQDVTNFISTGYLLANAGSFAGLPLPTLPDITLINSATGPAKDHTTSMLNDRGIGAYGEISATWADAWTLTLGLRHDREHKAAAITEGTVLPTAGGDVPLHSPTTVDATRNYSATTPRATLQWHFAEDAQVYASAASGYRAGGFNPQSPAGQTAYREERSTNLEAGAKALLFDKRVQLGIAVFHIALDDLQLNLPIPNGAGRFYIANSGRATSRGVELEARAKPWKWLTLFGDAGLLDARFGDGSQAMGEDVSGKRLPYAEPFNATLGAQVIWPTAIGKLSFRAEGERRGGGWYDAGNHERQPPYLLGNLRAGWSYSALRLEAWVKNIGNTAAIPLAIPYTGIAPSGYAGENAPPRTFGLNLNIQL